MRTTYSISFFCRASKASKKTGLSPIEMSICINGDRLFINLPYKADSRRFQSHKDKQLTQYLSTVQVKANDAVIDLTSKNIPVTATALRDYLKWGGTKSYTINDLWSSFMEDIKHRVGVSMKPLVYTKYELVRQSFISFIGSTTEVNSITKGDIQRWSISLSNKLKSSTIAGYQTKLKTVFFYAIDNGYIKVNPFSGIKIQHPQEQIEYLTEVELDKLRNFDCDIQRLVRVKDLFLFQCFTGLSYIDMANLSLEDIQESNGVFFISKKRQKTGVEFTTAIMPEGVAIIKKYGGVPILSNQRFNSYMKEIADLTGIKKNLHSHLARKTYATLLLNKGVRIEVVARCLGHSNTKVTQRYYAKMQDSTILKEVSSIF